MTYQNKETLARENFLIILELKFSLQDTRKIKKQN